MADIKMNACISEAAILSPYSRNYNVDFVGLDTALRHVHEKQ